MAGARQPNAFPATYHCLIDPALNALNALGGEGTRGQIVARIIEDLRLPPSNERDFWEDFAPAHQTNQRRRRELLNDRTGKALQELNGRGRVEFVEGRWRLQT